LKSNVVLATYNGKGDPMKCGSYTEIKLLEHALKVVERIWIQNSAADWHGWYAVWIYER